MVYDANLKHMYNNKQSIDIPEVKKEDMNSNEAAIKVFKHYFGLATLLDVSTVYKVSLRFPKTHEPTDDEPKDAGAHRKGSDGSDDDDKKPASSPRKKLKQILAAWIDHRRSA